MMKTVLAITTVLSLLCIGDSEAGNRRDRLAQLEGPAFPTLADPTYVPPMPELYGPTQHETYRVAPPATLSAPGALHPEVIEPGIIYEEPIPVPIYRNVRYRQERNIHPNAVKTIVSAPNPTWDPRDPLCPKCVFVEICIPPCELPCAEVRRSGRMYKYDFGKYEVDLIIRRNYILVDYDD